MQTLILTFVKKSYLDVFEGLGSWEYLYFILVFFKFVNEIFSSLSFFNVDYCLATISWCSLRVFGSIFLLDFFFFYFFIAFLLFFFFFFWLSSVLIIHFEDFFQVYIIFSQSILVFELSLLLQETNSSCFALKFPMVIKQHRLFVHFTWKFCNQHLCK